MPKLAIRKQNEVPPPNPSPRAVKEQQQAYEAFIRRLDGNVGGPGIRRPGATLYGNRSGDRILDRGQYGLLPGAGAHAIGHRTYSKARLGGSEKHLSA